MAQVMLINVTEGAPAGGFASDGSSYYSYLDSVLPAYLKNDFHYTFCAEPMYYMQLASCLREEDITVEIIDGILMNLRLSDIRKVINKTESRIFGLTMFQANYRAVMDIIFYIRSVYPDSVIFSGGTYASNVYSELLLRHKEIDYVVVGDGDKAVPALCKAVLKGTETCNISGVAYLKGNTVMLPTPEAVDLDTIPWPARDFSKEIKKYNFSFSMVTSRGCGHGVCAFCYLPMYQKHSNHPKYRFRSPEDVVDEMVFLKDTYGISRITFVDEDYFGVHSVGIPRAEKIADLLIEKRVRVTYYVNARINSLIEVIRQGLLPKLASSGLKYAFIGIESGSNSILRKYKKGTSVERIHQVIDELKQYGIKINPGLITFDPDLTVSEVIDNVHMLEYTGYYDVFMFTRKLVLLPGIKVGSIHQGWNLPPYDKKQPDLDIYFKNKKTSLLYDALVWLRDSLFPIYRKIDQKIQIGEHLREDLVQNHFNAFYQIAAEIENGSINDFAMSQQFLVPFVHHAEELAI